MTEETRSQEALLFVDDEPGLLAFFEQAFDGVHRVITAMNGAEGLAVLSREAGVAVIIADLNMPAMNGIEFLDKAREVAPDATRLIITGYSSEASVIEAVNRNELFRYLTKPVRVPELREAVSAALERHRRLTAERNLLEETLKGSVDVLTQALSMASPGIFGRAARQRDGVNALCDAMGVKNRWELETTALLSQIGLLTAAPRLAEKIINAQPLTAAERPQVWKQASVGADLIAKVPRLETVADGIRMQYKNFDGSGYPEHDCRSGCEIPLAARMLCVLEGLQGLFDEGEGRKSALKALRAQEHRYDPALLDALALSRLARDDPDAQREVPVRKLTPGVRLAEDLRNTKGALVIRAGQEVTEYLAEKILVFADAQEIPSKLKIVDE